MFHNATQSILIYGFICDFFNQKWPGNESKKLFRVTNDWNKDLRSNYKRRQQKNSGSLYKGKTTKSVVDICNIFINHWNS